MKRKTMRNISFCLGAVNIVCAILLFCEGRGLCGILQFALGVMMILQGDML